MTYVKGCWGKSPVQRLNVINTNGVHFNSVSGNQELLTLNCGEHKPPDCTRTRKQPQRSKGASNIPTWQATEKQPSSTEQTEQQYSTATQTATGAVATKPHKQTTSLSTTQAETTQQPTSYPHAEPATQSAEQSTSTTKPHNAKATATPP